MVATPVGEDPGRDGASRPPERILVGDHTAVQLPQPAEEGFTVDLAERGDRERSLVSRSAFRPARRESADR